MATGRLPFEASSSLAVIKQHLHEPPPNPLAFNPRCRSVVLCWSALASCRSIATIRDEIASSDATLTGNLPTPAG
jgi:hypothetical protein